MLPTIIQYLIANKETSRVVVLLEVVHDSSVTSGFVLCPRRSVGLLGGKLYILDDPRFLLTSLMYVLNESRSTQM